MGGHRRAGEDAQLTWTGFGSLDQQRPRYETLSILLANQYMPQSRQKMTMNVVLMVVLVMRFRKLVAENGGGEKKGEGKEKENCEGGGGWVLSCYYEYVL